MSLRKRNCYLWQQVSISSRSVSLSLAKAQRPAAEPMESVMSFGNGVGFSVSGIANTLSAAISTILPVSHNHD